MAKKKKILLFGGTFNPIHNAHLIVARTVAEQMKMDRIVLIPNGIPPHKKRVVNPLHKYEMIKLSICSSLIFDTTTYEIDKITKAYTIETIRRWKDVLGKKIDKPYWLIGTDNLEDLKNWYKIEALIKECIMVVAGSTTAQALLSNSVSEDSRWHNVAPYNNYSFYRKMASTMHTVIVPQLEIRSTIIRQRVKDGLSIKYLVPELVEKYIYENHLYQS